MCVCLPTGPSDGGIPLPADQDADPGQREAQPVETVGRTAPGPVPQLPCHCCVDRCRGSNTRPLLRDTFCFRSSVAFFQHLQRWGAGISAKSARAEWVEVRSGFRNGCEESSGRWFGKNSLNKAEGLEKRTPPAEVRTPCGAGEASGRGEGDRGRRSRDVLPSLLY